MIPSYWDYFTTSKPWTILRLGRACCMALSSSAWGHLIPWRVSTSVVEPLVSAMKVQPVLQTCDLKAWTNDKVSPASHCASLSTAIPQVSSVRFTLLVSGYAKINVFSSLIISPVGYVKALEKQSLLHCSVSLLCWTSLMFLKSVKILSCACIALDTINGSSLRRHHIWGAIPSQHRNWFLFYICLY